MTDNFGRKRPPKLSVTTSLVTNEYLHENCVSMKRCGFTAWTVRTARWSWSMATTLRCSRSWRVWGSHRKHSSTSPSGSAPRTSVSPATTLYGHKKNPWNFSPFSQCFHPWKMIVCPNLWHFLTPSYTHAAVHLNRLNRMTGINGTKKCDLKPSCCCF